MKEIICNEYQGYFLIRGSKKENNCTSAREIKNGVVQKCPNEKCMTVPNSQLNKYTGKIKFDPVALTIESWEWRSKTGEKYLYNWEKFVEINKLIESCGFHNYYCADGTCRFYDKTKDIGNRCFSGLYNKWRNAVDIEDRKACARCILTKIRDIYN